jgi:hypothetical protein
MAVRERSFANPSAIHRHPFILQIGPARCSMPMAPLSLRFGCCRGAGGLNAAPTHHPCRLIECPAARFNRLQGSRPADLSIVERKTAKIPVN